MVQKAQSNDVAAQRQFLPDPSKMNLLPDGEAIVINRPLAIQYEIPGRGNTPHQIDNNVKTEDFSPSPNDGPIDTMPDPDTVHGKDIYSELIPPKPVPVVIIPKPYRTSLKTTRMITIFNRGHMVLSGPPGRFNNGNTQMLVGLDYTRNSITIPPCGDGNGPLDIQLAISDDTNFNSYVIWDTASTLTFYGQNALYASIWSSGEGGSLLAPITAYVETETSLDSNP